jgi:hypothetical protein
MERTISESEGEASFLRLPWLPYLLFAVVVAILAIPILSHFRNWGVRDWDLFTTLHAAAVGAIKDYGQFPFWNPYIGGGNILFAHPEVPVFNPLFGLLLLFGPLAGLKIQILVIYYLGLVGGYKLARQMGMNVHGAIVTPVVYMLSSYLTLHVAAGHIPFHYFAVLPWLVFFYRKSLDRPRWILAAGGAVAFIILGSGAAVPFLFSLFFLILISLFDIGRGRGFRPPVYAVGAAVCGILFAAVKFFPMYDYLTQYPWIPEGTVQTTPLSIFPKMFFAFNQSLFAEHIEGYVWGWHEYGVFVGPVAALLAAVGVIAGFRKTWPYLALTGISFVLVLGSFLPPYSPWDLLHRLPGFESIRVPSRFSLLALFPISILAGWGTETVVARFRYRRVAAAAAIFVAVLGINLIVCLPILGEAFTRAPEYPARESEFRQTVGDPNRMYAGFLANRGTIYAAWLSAYRPGRGILDYSNQPSEWYSENNAVRVIGRKFTPNRITYDVESIAGGTLVVSQGYDTGWRRTDGGPVISFQDLVSFNVSPGQKRVEIYYYPEYFTLGAIVSVLSVLLAVGAAVRFRR